MITNPTTGNLNPGSTYHTLPVYEGVTALTSEVQKRIARLSMTHVSPNPTNMELLIFEPSGSLSRRENNPLYRAAPIVNRMAITKGMETKGSNFKRWKNQ